MKLPNFLSVESRPFDAETYEVFNVPLLLPLLFPLPPFLSLLLSSSSTQDEMDEEGQQQDEEGRTRLKLKVADTLSVEPFFILRHLIFVFTVSCQGGVNPHRHAQ